MYIRFTGGLVNRKDPRQVGPDSLVTATNVEMRPGSDSLFPTNMLKDAGGITASNGNDDAAGLIFAAWDDYGAFLVTSYEQNVYEAAAVITGMTGTKQQIGGADITFQSAPLVLSGMMFADKLFVVGGVGCTAGGNEENRNLVRYYNTDGTATWRFEGIKPPANFSGISLTDCTFTTAGEVAGAATYYPTYDSGNSDANQVAGGVKAANASDVDYAKITVGNKNVTRSGVWEFTDNQATQTGVLSILIGAGPAGKWDTIGAGGTVRVSLDSDVKVYYSTDWNGNSGTWTLARHMKGPAVPEYVQVPLTVSNINVLAVKVSVTKNSGDLDATAFVYTVKFDVGGGAGATGVNTATDTGIHYLVTNANPLLGLESEPAPLVPGPGHITFPAATYATGVLSISFTLPTGSAQDTNATDYRVYMSPDGADKNDLSSYGLIGTVKIDRNASQSFTHVLSIHPITAVPQTGLSHIALTQDDVKFTFPKGGVPPVAKDQCVYKGSRILLGLDGNIYYTPPYEWEYVPGLYNIPSRSPRNDEPTAVETLQEAWFTFYRDYTRRCQGLALVLDGQFDATSYSEASPERGAAGPNAVCVFSRDGEMGNAWLFCVDKLGFYIRNEHELQPWSNNLIWTDHVTPANGLADPRDAYLEYVTAIHNPEKQRIEVFYIAPGASDLSGWDRLDVYYNRIRPDGQPVILGPHNVTSFALPAVGYDSNGYRRVWVGSRLGVDIAVYTDDPAQATAVPIRVVQTGDSPISEDEEDVYLKYVEVKSSHNSTDSDIYGEALLRREGYETSRLGWNHVPDTPARVGVWARAEYITLYLSDSAGDTSTDPAEILGVGLTFRGKGGAQKTNTSASNFDTTTDLPKS